MFAAPKSRLEAAARSGELSICMSRSVMTSVALLNDRRSFLPSGIENTAVCTVRVHDLPIVPQGGGNPSLNLENCAKTAAKINVQEIIPIDESRSSWRG
jgi:hypothetical protein